MSKKTIWLVTFALSFTLIGLFVVQGFWIRNALRINEQQFDQLINKTLTDVVKQLENQEMVYQIINEVEPYEQERDGIDRSVSYQLNKTQQKQYSLNQYSLDKQILQVDNLDSVDFSARFDLISSKPLQFESEEKYRMSQSLKEKFKERLENELHTDLSEKRVFVENIVNKLIQVDVGLENRLNPHIVDSLLSKELNEQDIQLDYEFAVVNEKDSVVFSSGEYQPEMEDVVYKDRLFPSDVVEKDNFLKVYFRERQGYIFKSTGSMTLISIILSFVVILGFAITTHIMFKQKRLSRVKNDFVNNMTHELKTPISTISLATQMLKDDSLPESSKNLGSISKIIDDETIRLSSQVEKVLKTAVFNSGKLNIKPKELDLHEVIENVLKSFYLQVENQHGTIEKHLDASNPQVEVDEVHFTNVMFNLLDNAVKYSPEQPLIKVETQDVRQDILVAVEDNGMGIRKKDQKKIFDQFYRVPTGNVHDVKGFGLGLNYVKKMVEEHNGEIRLQSEYRKGTRFEIIIPKNNHKKNGNRNN
ncbi:MAG: HAMP domain-containing histidine kinase [Bacteroidales bacterium]|nr:HAMP domain-containing histidine kinase [Bacteroidales bacterium]